LNALFAEPPQFDVLAADFIRNYHRAADLLYQAFMESEPHRVAASRNFHFDLYASGEYAKMLAAERGEEQQPPGYRAANSLRQNHHKSVQSNASDACFPLPGAVLQARNGF